MYFRYCPTRKISGTKRVMRVLLFCGGLASALVHLTPPLNSLRWHPTALGATPPASSNNNNNLPIDRIEKHFINVMQNDKVKLFENFPNYLESLPERDFGSAGDYERLCQFPFWANCEDMATMVKQLEDRNYAVRRTIKYMCSPSASGKTSSVLIAFLESAEKNSEDGFKYYLYLPSANSYARDYRFRIDKLSKSVRKAYNQGGAFAFECVQHLFDQDTGLLSEVDENVQGHAKTVKQMSEYLRSRIPEGRILIHFDEHREMCDVEGMPEQSAAFRRGAMIALALMPDVDVIATYVEPIVELPASGSSGYCRIPVTLPIVDVSQVMKAVPDLNFAGKYDPATFDAVQERLWATLYFLLGLRLGSRLENQVVNMVSVHIHLRSSNAGKSNGFIKQFHGAFATVKDVTTALNACIRLCAFSNFIEKNTMQYATELLLSVDEEKMLSLDRKISDIVLYDVGGIIKVTSSLGTLLSVPDSKFDAYLDGRDRCQKELISSTSVDLLSATPLEAAYSWTLACQSTSSGRLKFSRAIFKIRCERLLAGRLFQGQSTSDFDVSSLERNTIYYANETKDDTHPLCDIFFRTKKNEVVLIDIYGGQNQKYVNRKINELASWIHDDNFNRTIKDNKLIRWTRDFIRWIKVGRMYRVYGVVLAPFLPADSYTNGAVVVVRGIEAQGLLGGFMQAARWLKP